MFISGKQAEEIGFEKFSQRQARLQGIRVLVLDRMQIRYRLPLERSEDDRDEIAEVCTSMTEVDLSGNLFETIAELVDLCRRLPKLRVLTLDANRLSGDLNKPYATLSNVRSLSLSRTLLDDAEVSKFASCLPALEHLNLADNGYSDTIDLQGLPSGLRTLDLSKNEFASLSDLGNLEVNCPHLHALILKYNRISSVSSGPSFSLGVIELDLSHNHINDWSFFNSLMTNESAMLNLKHLRITGNPLYKHLVSAEGKSLTTEDGYMLTIARLPRLEELNYRKVTQKERLNAETYYLNQIGIELSNVPETQAGEVRRRHPRYEDLCEEYGEPSILRDTPKADEIDANSLTARLIVMAVVLAPGVLPTLASQRSWLEEVPRSFTVYSLLGMIGKRLDANPLALRLVLEAGERDPVGRDSGYAGPEWWDSSDDEAEVHDKNGENGEWVAREVEMVAGTRTLGTFVEGREARVRIEMRDVG